MLHLLPRPTEGVGCRLAKERLSGRLPVTPSRNNSQPSQLRADLDLLAEESERWWAELPALLEAKRVAADRDEQARLGLKAMMLASSLEVCRALLRGERVPWNVLNYWQAERFGLRRRQPDGRYGLDDFNDIRRPA